MTIDDLTLVQQCKVLITLSPLNEAQLAANIGLSVSHLSNMLCERKRFQVEQMEALLAEMGYELTIRKIAKPKKA